MSTENPEPDAEGTDQAPVDLPSETQEAEPNPETMRLLFERYIEKADATIALNQQRIAEDLDSFLYEKGETPEAVDDQIDPDKPIKNDRIAKRFKRMQKSLDEIQDAKAFQKTLNTMIDEAGKASPPEPFDWDKDVSEENTDGSS